MFNRERTELKIETLRYHNNLFDLLSRRHYIWLDRATNPEVRNLHVELLELFRQLIQKYKRLIELECRDEVPKVVHQNIPKTEQVQ